MKIVDEQGVILTRLLAFQKLHSRILDLSAADLLLEPERSKAFLLSRSTDSPSNVSSVGITFLHEEIIKRY